MGIEWSPGDRCIVFRSDGTKEYDWTVVMIQWDDEIGEDRIFVVKDGMRVTMVPSRSLLDRWQYEQGQH